MARWLALLGMAFLASAVVLTPRGPAAADTAVFTDPTGDTTLESWESGQTFTGQSDPTVDITRVHVDHGDSQLIVTVSVVDVQRLLPHRLRVEVVTPVASGDDSFVVAFRRGDSTSVGSMAVLQRDGRVACTGYSAAVSLTENTLQVRVPTSCFDHPDWVRVAATVSWRETACHPFCVTRSYDRAPDAPGSYFDRVYRTTPYASPYADVVGTTHEQAILAMIDAGIAVGYSDGTFRPAGNVTRGQMAAFLTRALELDEADPPFADSVGTTHERAIGAVVQAGIAVGYSDGTFRPAGNVTRGQMAAFLSRALGIEES